MPKAKARALASVAGWREAHRDDMFEAEQAFAIGAAGNEPPLHIHLTPSALVKALEFTCDYMPIRARSPR